MIFKNTIGLIMVTHNIVLLFEYKSGISDTKE